MKRLWFLLLLTILTSCQKEEEASLESLTGSSTATSQTVLRASSILPDGSFNPTSATRIPFATKLQTSAVTSWRRTLPKSAEGGAEGKRFAVFPFLDRTRSGVGDRFTFGWHLLGTAALSVWSNARIEPVANYELLSWDKAAPPKTTIDQILVNLPAALKADPSLASVDRVVTGIYSDGTASNTVRLSVFLVLPKENRVGMKILETKDIADRDLQALESSQRSAARDMVRKLVDSGEVKAAKTVVTAADLDKALADAATLLNISDFYAVQEGIDNALALARRAPEEPAPLQAAAMGYAEMLFFVEQNGWNNLFSYDLKLRGYALSQLALSCERGRPLSQMQAYTFDRMLGREVPANVVEQTKPTTQPLTGAWAVFANFTGDMPSAAVNSMPDWQRLYAEARQTESRSGSPDRTFFEECAAAGSARDLFAFLACKRALNPSYSPSDRAADRESMAETFHLLAFQAMREQAAAALCLLCADPKMRKEAKWFANGLGVALEVKPRLLLKLAGAGKYYELCQAMESGTQGWLRQGGLSCRWGALENDTCNYYSCLRLFRSFEPKIRAAAGARSCPDGIPGLSFSAWERWKLLDRLRATGFAMFCDFLESRVEDHKLANDVITFYMTANPDDAYMMWEVANPARGHRNGKDSAKTVIEYKERTRSTFPMGPESLYQLGRLSYYMGNKEKGYDLLRQTLRSDPFNDMQWKSLAEAFARYREYGRAQACYDRYFESRPKDWKARIDCGFLLAGLGRPTPVIGEAFEKALAEQGGDKTSLQLSYLDYLLNKKDRVAATRILGKMAENPANRIRVAATQFDFLVSDGKTSEAEHLIDKLRPVSKDKALLADDYALGAISYLRVNRPEKAELALQGALKQDPNRALVYEAAAKVSAQEGIYNGALRQLDDLAARYPASLSSDLIRFYMDCLRKAGYDEEAFTILEKRATSDRPDLLATLAEHYLATWQRDKIRPLVEKAYQMPERTVAALNGLLDVYAKVDPADAAKRKAGLVAFFEGPPLSPDFR